MDVRVLLMAAFAVAILGSSVFSGAGAIGLIGPDEPRYAAVAREMAASGDWVTPRLNGVPWFEKPVLYYWSAALSFRLLGVSDAAARLPSALALTLSTLMLAWLCRRAYGPSAAFALLMIAPTTVAAIGFSRAATPDMLLSSSLILASISAAWALRLHSRERETPDSAAQSAGASLAWTAAWGAFLGLGVLAKGPAALLLAWGSVGLWMLATQRWKDGARLWHPIALGATAAVALPWYLLCAARNPDFVQVFLIEHNVQRYLTPAFGHEQPFWFFGPVLLIGLVPWTALLIPVAQDIGRTAPSRWAHSLGFFMACWIVFPLVFFSLSVSKLPGYILPAIPLLALLMARTTARAAVERPGSLSRLLVGVGLTIIALAITAGVAAQRLPDDLRLALDGVSVVLAICLLLGACGVAVVTLARLQRLWMAVALTAAVTAGGMLGITFWLGPALDSHLTPRAAASAAERAADGRPVSVYQLHRAWHYGLNYYFQRELPEWTEAEVGGVIVTSGAGIRDLVGRGYLVNVVEEVSAEAVVVTIDSRSAGAGASSRGGHRSVADRLAGSASPLTLPLVGAEATAEH